MSGRKRGREQPDRGEGQDRGIERSIKELDRDGALRMLDDLCQKWQLGPQGPSTTFEIQTMQMFCTLGMNFDDNLLEALDQDRGSFGLREVDEAIRTCELEAIGLYHRLRELDLFPGKDAPDPEKHLNLRRVTKVLEMIFYAKRVVLSAFQAKLAVHQLHLEDGTLDLDQDLDTRLGAWALRFRYIDGDMTPLQSLLLYLLDAAMEKKYRKASGWMWEPVVVDGVDTHAWQPVCEIKDFVYRELPKETCWEQWKNATQNMKNIPAAVEYLTNCRDHQLPVLVKQRGVYSFKNGVYLAAEDRFHSFANAEQPLSDSVVACKYIDEHFTPYERWQDIPTPYFDSIANHQGWSDEVRQWMYVLIGRMLYAINEHDGWQVVPFFKGKAGTGKSTLLLKVCKSFYEPVDVGILSNNIERKFGISAFHDKYLVLAPEIRNDLAMEQGEFQSIVSGEDVQVNVKHQKAFSKEWTVPLGLAGNEVPGWADAAGSIQRRCVVFEFMKSVRNGDMKLGEKLERELPNIVQKCNKAYLEQARQHSDKNIWTVLPEYFIGTREALAQATNSVEGFLATTDVKVGPDQFCPLDDFKSALREYEHRNSLRPTAINNKDVLEGPFEKLGLYTIREVRSYRGVERLRDWVVGCDINLFHIENALG